MGPPDQTMLRELRRRHEAAIGGRHSLIVIETGTYRGAGTYNLSHVWPIVHTIEASLDLANRADEVFMASSGIFVHHGNSPDILSAMSPFFDNIPLCYFLDAHDVGTPASHKSMPLLAELKVIQARKRLDLVIIDDLRMLGTKGRCGSHLSDEYPLMEYDWSEITVDRVKATLDPEGRGQWEAQDDRLICFTRPRGHP